jgi:RimJ/RimL family protein N-acetyltransferase
VKLIAPDAELLALAATWLADESNTRWLDFGHGRQTLPPGALMLMAKQPAQMFRIFTSETDDRPVGLVALSDIAPTFGTANLWYVLGAKEYGGRGLTTRAVSRLLTEAFADRHLVAVSAWAVDVNRASIAVLEKNRFTLIGRQRRCHVVGGDHHDRLLYDLLAEEHEELKHAA